MQAHATAQAILTTTEGIHVPLAKVSASGKLTGLLFEMTVEQHYRNACAAPIESVYTFPLPLNAVLLAFELELNGVTHQATAFGKQQAEHKYETAIDEGNSAALLVDNGNGLFTVNVANLMPGESAVVRYRYAELLSAHKDHVRLNVPTAIAPRYGQPSDAGLGGPAIPGADLLAEYPFNLRLEITGFEDAAKAHSPTHSISKTAIETGLRVEIARNGFLDRDFVLLLDGAATRANAQVAPDGQDFMALASAVIAATDGDDRPLAAKILLDCSGSMAGDSIEAAKRALAKLLEGMRPSDRFSLQRFGSRVIDVTEGLEPGDSHTIEPLKLVVARINADLGGTEMASAVQAALRIPAPEGSKPDLVLITDGEVYAVDGVVETAVKSGHRLFVVAIGAASNEALARKVSERTGGACDFVVAGEAVEPAILRMFGRLRAVPRRVARVHWPAEVLWTTPLPNAVYPNETLHVMAGFRTQPTAPVSITIQAQDGASIEVTLPVAAAMTTADAFPRMAAARRLAALPAEEAKALAIKYQLASEHTSLVLVAERAEGDKAVDIPSTVAVPQMLAAGWGGTMRVAGAAAPAPKLRSRSFSLADSGVDMASTKRSCRADVPRGKPSKEFDDDTSGNFQGEIEQVRKPLLAAVAKALQSGGKLPESVKELEAIYPLASRLRGMLNGEIKRYGMSPAVVIRAFLELLDRDEGMLSFPSVDAETKRQVRVARKALEKHF